MKTIRELATALALSKTTVADALNDKSVVSEKTRLHVQAKARELGYRPNPIATSFLRQIRSSHKSAYRGNLAYLGTFPPGGLAACHLAQRLFHAGAAARSAELGYGFETIRLNTRGVTASRLSGILTAKGVLGVIVGPLTENAGHVDLEWSRFAAVTPGFSVRTPRLPRIGHHCAHAINTIMEACRARGLRRVGLALTDEGDLRVERAWSGAMLARQRTLPAGDRVEPLIVPLKKWNTKTRAAWLAAQKPDAVVIAHRSAWEVPVGARRRPPALITLDCAPEDAGPGIDQRHGLCGAMAVDLLSTQILHQETGLPLCPTTVLVEGVWRGSIGGTENGT